MPADGTKHERKEKTAREILAQNESMFEMRKRELQKLAQRNPQRHSPSKRTFWDVEEIRAQVYDLPVDDRAAAKLLKALRLATSITVLEALLEGQDVPLEQLDPEWAKAYGYR